MPISPEEKDRLFRNPPPGQLHLGRSIATVAHGERLWSAVQMGKDKQTWIHLMRSDASGASVRFDTPPGCAHQPCDLCSGKTLECLDVHTQPPFEPLPGFGKKRAVTAIYSE